MIAHSEKYRRATEREANRRKVDKCVEVVKDVDVEMQMEVTVNDIEKLENEMTQLRDSEKIHHVQQAIILMNYIRKLELLEEK